MRIILATNSNEINTFIIENLSQISFVGEVSSKKQLLRQFEKEDSYYDLVVFSTLLSGNENITETIFNILKKQECRFIVLAKNTKEACLQDLFYLGIRDFLVDPINPHILLKRIQNPSQFKDAIEILNVNEPSRKFKQFFRGLIKDDNKESYLTNDAQDIVNGITKLLNIDFSDNIEKTFFEIEQEIIKKFLISSEEKKHI